MKFKYTVNYPTRTIVAEGTTINNLKYTGKAKCSPEDVFDVKKGKKLARLRAELKQLTAIRKFVDHDIEEILGVLEKYNKRMSELQDTIFKKIMDLKTEERK